jgi:hypothetical protein
VLITNRPLSPLLPEGLARDTLSLFRSLISHMEDHLEPIATASLSDVAQLRHRQSAPDVPEDIEDEIMRHFNDPNWDFQANSSTISLSTDGVAPKRWSKSSTHMGASTEVDTESQISSWRIHDSKAEFSSDDSPVQWVSFTRRPYRILFIHFVSSGIRPILRSGHPSRILTTRPCL